MNLKSLYPRRVHGKSCLGTILCASFVPRITSRFSTIGSEYSFGKTFSKAKSGLTPPPLPVISLHGSGGDLCGDERIWFKPLLRLLRRITPPSSVYRHPKQAQDLTRWRSEGELLPPSLQSMGSSPRDRDLSQRRFVCTDCVLDVGRRVVGVKLFRYPRIRMPEMFRNNRHWNVLFCKPTANRVA